MPDGDRRYNAIKPVFRKLVKQMCQNMELDEQFMTEFARSLKKSLQGYGDGPVSFLKEIAPLFEQAARPRLFADGLNFRELDEAIRKGQLLIQDKRAAGLVTNARERQKERIRKGDTDSRANMFTETFVNYAFNVVDSDCLHLLPQVVQQIPGIDSKRVLESVQAVRAAVAEQASQFAKQAERNSSVKKLRMRPNKSRPSPPDLGENLTK
jgi:hypothetical protein